MRRLFDTNVLLRAASLQGVQARIAWRAIKAVVRNGDAPCVTPQILVEFWCVATRQKKVNGLGWTPKQARRTLARIEKVFEILRDSGAVYDEWLRLVVEYSVSGLVAYDARLVASMRVHNVASILTFNTSDFVRFEGVEVVDPGAVF